jgi:hypothetical protein
LIYDGVELLEEGCLFNLSKRLVGFVRGCCRVWSVHGGFTGEVMRSKRGIGLISSYISGSMRHDNRRMIRIKVVMKLSEDFE